MVLAPEHPLVAPLTHADHRDDVRAYQEAASQNPNANGKVQATMKSAAAILAAMRSIL